MKLSAAATRTLKTVAERGSVEWYAGEPGINLNSLSGLINKGLVERIGTNEDNHGIYGLSEEGKKIQF